MTSVLKEKTPETFYSEFGEDRWIAEHLPLPQFGTYLDVGCADAVNCSNTAFLRARGWQGAGIDANPTYADSWTQGTFIQAFVSDRPFVEFSFKDIPGHSRVEPSGVAFAAVTLERIRQALAFHALDFLSLDLEGHEYNALISLSQFALPPIIVSEFNTHGIGEDMRVRDFLLNHGFKLVHQTVANHVFFRA